MQNWSPIFFILALFSVAFMFSSANTAVIVTFLILGIAFTGIFVYSLSSGATGNADK